MHRPERSRPARSGYAKYADRHLPPTSVITDRKDVLKRRRTTAPTDPTQQAIRRYKKAINRMRPTFKGKEYRYAKGRRSWSKITRYARKDPRRPSNAWRWARETTYPRQGPTTRAKASRAQCRAQHPGAQVSEVPNDTITNQLPPTNQQATNFEPRPTVLTK